LENITTEKLDYGKIDSTWNQYGLQEAYINYGKTESGWKAIIKNGKILSIVRKGYKLIPNEEALGIADKAAKDANLIPFDKLKQQEHAKDFGRHVLLEKDGRRMHAAYAANTDYKIGTDKVFVGVTVNNSIDSSLSFSTGYFTFRGTCQNLVLGIARRMSALDREAVNWVYRRHTANFDIELKDVLINAMDSAKKVLEQYRELAIVEANKAWLTRIQNSRLSKKSLPGYLKAEEKQATIVPEHLTQWQVYNDITEIIWHNPKAQLKTKIHQYNILHKAIEIKI